MNDIQPLLANWPPAPTGPDKPKQLTQRATSGQTPGLSSSVGRARDSYPLGHWFKSSLSQFTVYLFETQAKLWGVAKW